MVKKVFPLILSVFFAFIAGFALLHSGLPPTHDGEYHVIRFYEFDKVLRAGDWYPRWAPDLNFGYGVPLFNYVYPFPNYFASVLHFFGISFIDSFKYNLFFATIVGAIFFYLFAKEYWGEIGAIVSAVFYTYTPYRFVDIYIRGSVGEVWALAFFPGFLWAVTRLAKKHETVYILLSAVFLALTIFSHNILAVMFFLFCLTYIVYLLYAAKNRKQFLFDMILSLILGLGLSAIFWLPALVERQYVTGLQIYSVKENFPELFQLLIPSWGSGFSGQGLQDQMSFQIGIANLLVVIGVSFLLLFSRKRNLLGKVIIFFLLWFLLIFFLLLSVSYPVWKILPVMDYFQFPWRFLSLMMLVTSFLAGGIVGLWRSRVIAGILVLISLLLSIGYMRPAFYHERNDTYYITRSNFIDGTNSPGNYFHTIWMSAQKERSLSKIQYDPNVASVEPEAVRPTAYFFSIQAKNDEDILVNTAYFPGWTAFVDGKKAQTSNSKGIIGFRTPQGQHFVEVVFLDTMVRMLASFITIVSGFVLIVLSVKILWLRYI